MHSRTMGKTLIFGAVIAILFVFALACSADDAEAPKAPSEPKAAAPAAKAVAAKEQKGTVTQTARPASAPAAATAAPAQAAATAAPLPTSIARPAPTAISGDAIVRGGHFTIGTAQPVQFLDPHRGGLANNRNAFIGLFNSLTDWGYDCLLYTSDAADE